MIAASNGVSTETGKHRSVVCTTANWRLYTDDKARLIAACASLSLLISYLDVLDSFGRFLEALNMESRIQNCDDPWLSFWNRNKHVDSHCSYSGKAPRLALLQQIKLGSWSDVPESPITAPSR